MNKDNKPTSPTFSFTPEQQQFRDSVQRFLNDHSPIAEARRVMETDTGFDAVVWQRLNKELGLGALHVPENYGGLGFGAVELGIAMEEFGRVLLAAPFFGSSVLATLAILECGDDGDKTQLLPAISSGEQLAALAFAERGGRWDNAGLLMTAKENTDGLKFSGEKRFVVDGASAELLVVAVRTPGSSADAGVSLVVVDADAKGVQRRALTSLDRTRRLAEIKFDNVIGQPLGAIGGAGPGLARAIDAASIALANEMVGGAQALLDMAVEYAGMRMQFGRLIGSFQAIKHKCADLLLSVELARSAAYYASEALANRDPGNHPGGDQSVAALAGVAKAMAAESYMKVAAECIQIHGGIGFTWDHNAHLWYRRAKSSEVLLGTAAWHRERYLSEMEKMA